MKQTANIQSHSILISASNDKINQLEGNKSKNH